MAKEKKRIEKEEKEKALKKAQEAAEEKLARLELDYFDRLAKFDRGEFSSTERRKKDEKRFKALAQNVVANWFMGGYIFATGAATAAVSGGTQTLSGRQTAGVEPGGGEPVLGAKDFGWAHIWCDLGCRMKFAYSEPAGA